MSAFTIRKDTGLPVFEELVQFFPKHVVLWDTEEVRAAAGFNALMEGQRNFTHGTASNTHTLPLENLGLSL